MRSIGTGNQWYENITKTEDKYSSRAIISQESVDLGLNLSWTVCTPWWSFYTQDVLSFKSSLNPIPHSQHHSLDPTSSKNKAIKNKVLQLSTFSTVMTSTFQLFLHRSASFLWGRRAEDQVSLSAPSHLVLVILDAIPSCCPRTSFQPLPHFLPYLQPPFSPGSLPSAGKYAKSSPYKCPLLTLNPPATTNLSFILLKTLKILK